MQKQVSQLSQLFDQQNFGGVEALALEILNQKPNDCVVRLFLAQSLFHEARQQDCQAQIDILGQNLHRPKDDKVYFKLLQLQEKVAQAGIGAKNLSNNQRQTAQRIFLSNKFHIVEFFDQKKIFDKMLEQSEEYCCALLEAEQFHQIEDTYFWLLRHEGLPEEKRQEYGARIFQIDQYYNPKVALDYVFAEVAQLGSKNKQATSSLARLVLNKLERSTGPKTLLAALNSEKINPYIGYAKQLSYAGDFIFAHSEEAIYHDKLSLRSFAAFLTAKANLTPFGSDQWSELMTQVTSLASTQFQCDTLGDLQKNPLQLLLHCLKDINLLVNEACLPQSKSGDLFGCKPCFTLDDLESFCTMFGDLTPYVPLYYCCCASIKGAHAKQVNPKLSQAQYMLRKMKAIKQRKEPTDLTLLASCLKLQIIPQLEKDQQKQALAKCAEESGKIGQFSSVALQELHKGLVVNIKWQSSLEQGKWMQALEELDELVKVQPAKADEVSFQKCKIQYTNIGEFCSGPEEQFTFSKGLYNTLLTINSTQSLLMQGYLLFTVANLAGDQKQVVNKWLSALKLDQGNPDVFYSLAVYYYTAGDKTRAQKCLDKALLLKPGFEEAFLLQYHLFPAERRSDLIDETMRHNQNIAVTYYLKGIACQNQNDFISAIELFQNAIKFHPMTKQRASKRLLPLVSLPIHQNPLGIMGTGALVWVHLTECFWRIEKPAVALKCFNKALNEMTETQLEETQNCAECATLTKILDSELFQPDETEQEENPALELLSKVVSSPYYLECLLLGAHLTEAPKTSIQITRHALACIEQMNWSLFAQLLNELLARITQIVQQGLELVHGQTKVSESTFLVIEKLQQIIAFLETKPELMKFKNLQKRILTAMFIIAQQSHDAAQLKVAMQKADLLCQEFGNKGLCARSFLLDAAKITNEYQRMLDEDLDNDLQRKKMGYIKKALMLSPENANLWVHLHLFSSQQDQRALAIFKAYELEPASTFVQENLIKHYLVTEEWHKAFKILVRSYQQQADTNNGQHSMVLATLAYLNALNYAFDAEASFGQRRYYLLEALSLCRLVAREDQKQLLDEIFTYLSHFSGDYESTLPYLESRATEFNDLAAKAILQQAYFGNKKFTLADAVELASKQADLQPGTKEILQLTSLQTEELTKLHAQLMQLLPSRAHQVATKLVVVQELLLEKAVVPAQIAFEVPKILELIASLDPQLQRVFLIQSLRFVQIKLGHVPEHKSVIGEKRQSEQPAAPEQIYTEYIVAASRYKPQYLTQSQHKALLRFYLAAQGDPQLVVSGPVTKENSKSHAEQEKIQGLRATINHFKRQQIVTQEALDARPLCLETQVQYVWALLRDGQLSEALLRFDSMPVEQMEGSQRKYKQLSASIHALKASLAGAHASEEYSTSDYPQKQAIALFRSMVVAAEPVELDTRLSAIRLVKILASTPVPNQREVASQLCRVIEMTTASQGHHQAFNKLTKEIINVAATVLTDPELINELWCFQGLNSAACQIETKKLAAATASIKDMTQALQKGQVQRPPLPTHLLNARIYLASENPLKAKQSLNIDEAVIERDVLHALSLYALQEYKKYYITTIGLVAGAKTILDESQQGYWVLAYCYYLKAFAEMTFLAARKQNISLKEDFEQQEELEFDLAFFQRKATTSLDKCSALLELCGQNDTVVSKVVHEMQSQL